MTVLLARNRQSPINMNGWQRPTRRRRHRSEPLPTVTAGVPHAKFRLSFAAELVTLPSGLLAKVGEAIVKLEVLLGPTGLRTPAYSYCHPARRLHDGSLHIAGRTCLPHAARRKMFCLFRVLALQGEAPKCGKGHRLAPLCGRRSVYYGWYTCDTCGGVNYDGTRERWFCEHCDYNVCFLCFPRAEVRSTCLKRRQRHLFALFAQS